MNDRRYNINIPKVKIFTEKRKNGRRYFSAGTTAETAGCFGMPSALPFSPFGQFAVEVVLLGCRDACLVETAAPKPAAAGGNQQFLVDLGRIVLRAADVIVALPRVDHHALGTPHAAEVVVERNRLLPLHDPLHAPPLHLVGHIVLQMQRRIGTLLLGIGEDAQPVETHVVDELQQLREIGLRLARIAHEQRRTQSDVGHSRTQQRIDDEKTRTNLNSNSDRRNIRLNVSIFFHSKISERSTLSFNVSGKYAPGDRDGWRVDTTASTPGLQVKLRNDGDSHNYSFGANLGYRYKLGKKGSVNASYNFSRDYARSKQLAVDFLSDPQGVVDTVNSYHYTTDTYTHSLQTSLQYRSGDVWIMAGLGGVLYDIARSERFPKEERFPRLFFQLNPTVYLSVGKSRKRFSFNLASFPQMIPLDALRSTLNATNPLSLQAGNPGLKLQNDLSGSAGFQFTDVKKALSFSVRLNGSYTFNYIAQRRTLFLEDTYLPQYDYTARKGAQLTTQANVGGNYNLGGRVSYSQQINPLRSTLNVSVNYGFSQTPYFTGEDLFHSVRHSLGFGFGFDSGFSSKVKLNIRSNTSMSSYTTQKETAQELREQLTARVDLRFGKYFGSVGTLYEFYCNSRSHALTRHNVILNASAGRKFGKENRLGLSAGVIDILNRPDYATTSFDTDYIVTSSTSYLGRYGYLRVAYTF